jgi:hypothetical protein
MKIQFSTSGAAFYDEYEDYLTNESIKEQEVIRILKNIIDDIKLGCDCGSIMDINGNKIGEWSL